MKLTNLFIVATVGLLAACGPAASPEPLETEIQTLPSPTSQPATRMPEKTATPSESLPRVTSSVEPTEEKTQPFETVIIPDDAAIIFHRSGGFAGVDEQWTIYRDGRIEGPGGEQQQVEPETVQSLLETIQAAGFLELDDTYVPLDTCCDRFFYSIAVRLGDRIKTVRTIDASPTQPDELMTIIDAIGELIFR